MKSFPVLRNCAIRSRRPSFVFPARNAVISYQRPSARYASDDKSRNLHSAQPGQSGPNVVPEDHVSEEAAKIAKAQGKEGPDLSQGTPVQEILKDDEEARKQAPKAVKESIKAGTTPTPSTDPSGKRPFSTYTRRRAEMDQSSSGSQSPLDPSMIPSASQRAGYEDSMAVQSNDGSIVKQTGHKFPLPDMPLPKHLRKDSRYEPICEQFIGLIMRHGKKAVAQKNLDIILDTLRTSNPPTYNPQRPMIPGAPPASHLPLNPVSYFTLAIDSVAPLLRIRSIKGAAGGGAALQVPRPLTLQQRRRTAMMWIIESASKRTAMGSGEGQLGMRIASEIISIVEGRSAIWDRRNNLHRMGTAARININSRGRRR